jgi:aminoglycoside phosphotransferase (APT) family kinase protein
LDLPPHAELLPAELAKVAALLGERPDAVSRLEDVGICNAIYRIGTRYLLRVPHNEPRRFEELGREARTVAAAHIAGVQAPVLVLYDDSRRTLGVPFAVYEWRDGATLEPEPGRIVGREATWSAIGAQLARLHTTLQPAELSWLPTDEPPLPEEQLARRLSEGWLSRFEGDWLATWLSDLSDAAGPDAAPTTVTHGDMQAANILVDAQGALLALIDWGDARLADPAIDFAGIPLRYVAAMLDGHRTHGADAGAVEPRIIRRHLLLGLLQLGRGPLPDRSWAERPLSFLIEALHFFNSPPSPWPNWAPSSPGLAELTRHARPDRASSRNTSQPSLRARDIESAAA